MGLGILNQVFQLTKRLAGSMLNVGKPLQRQPVVIVVL